MARTALTAREKLDLLDRVYKQGFSIVFVCKDAGISRTLFYRWSKKYNPSENLDKNLSNLERKRKKYKKPFNKASEDTVRKIKEIIVKNPDLS